MHAIVWSTLLRLFWHRAHHSYFDDINQALPPADAVAGMIEQEYEPDSVQKESTPLNSDGTRKAIPHLPEMLQYCLNVKTDLAETAHISAMYYRKSGQQRHARSR